MVGLPVCFVLMFLLCQLTGSAASDSQKELVGAIGGSVTFPLNLSIVNIGSIVWIFNSTLVTFQPPKGEKPPMIIVTQSHKEKRVSFRNGECSLTLSKLQKNDSGTYRVEVHSTRNKLFTQEYVLHVYEPLSKPKVTMSLENTENGTCMVNLTCSLEQQGEDVAYSWKSLGKAANESHVGAIFPFSWRQGERNMTFICEATNPVSSNISLPVSSWKLCEGASGRSGRPVALLYCLLMTVLCILLLGLILIIQRMRRKVFVEKIKGIEIHQDIPAIGFQSEDTLYDKITYPNKATPEEDLIHTLYSTVHIPKKVDKPYSPSMTADTPGLFAYENII